MWDLRFATSPMKVMEGHTRFVMSPFYPLFFGICILIYFFSRFFKLILEYLLKFNLCYRGVLSLAWCPEDSDLLMSCGKVCCIYQS